MDIKQKIKNYFSKKSKWGIASDVIFVALIVAFLIPQSRLQLGTWVNQLKMLVISPSVTDESNAKYLKPKDYEVVFHDMQNNPVDLSELKGKVIFINFWATWCPPCIAEMPSIQTLYDKYKGNNEVVFLIVSNDKPEKIATFMKKNEYSFPVYTNQFKLPDIFSYTSIPTTFVISKSGKIVIHETGAADWASSSMFKIVDRLINE